MGAVKYLVGERDSRGVRPVPAPDPGPAFDPSLPIWQHRRRHKRK